MKPVISKEGLSDAEYELVLKQHSFEKDVIKQAVALVKAKLRWKGKPPGAKYGGGWTKAEMALYESAKTAGLL